MKSVTQIQIVDEICISHSNNILKKGILPPAMDEIIEKTELFNISTATGLGESKL